MQHKARISPRTACLRTPKPRPTTDREPVSRGSTRAHVAWLTFAGQRSFSLQLIDHQSVTTVVSFEAESGSEQRHTSTSIAVARSRCAKESLDQACEIACETIPPTKLVSLKLSNMKIRGRRESSPLMTFRSTPVRAQARAGKGRQASGSTETWAGSWTRGRREVPAQDCQFSL